jgi:putative ABC transport system ATP-binding protein
MDGMTVEALRGVTLGIAEGEYVAVTGPSGSGKSTLMHLLGALDRPSSGQLLIGGKDTMKLDDAGLARVRGAEIGFVFQAFQLLGRTNARDNVALPLVYRGVGKAERRRRAVAALEAVGLGHRLTHRPTQLSGGEQQRVAIARALVGEPRLVLADEPTGNLDSANGHEVLNVLERLNRERGVAVVLVTHDAEVAARADRLIRMKDGVVLSDEDQRPESALSARQARGQDPDPESALSAEQARKQAQERGLTRESDLSAQHARRQEEEREQARESALPAQQAREQEEEREQTHESALPAQQAREQEEEREQTHESDLSVEQAREQEEERGRARESALLAERAVGEQAE